MNPFALTYSLVVHSKLCLNAKWINIKINTKYMYLLYCIVHLKKMNEQMVNCCIVYLKKLYSCFKSDSLMEFISWPGLYRFFTSEKLRTILFLLFSSFLFSFRGFLTGAKLFSFFWFARSPFANSYSFNMIFEMLINLISQ